MRTAQEIFDTVVNGLRAQGKRSTAESPGGRVRCRYRTPEGLKCAVGQIIPDDQYKPEMEGLVVGGQEFTNLIADINLVEEIAMNRILLNELQRVHDTRDSFIWEKCWEELADSFGLKYTAKENNVDC